MQYVEETIRFLDKVKQMTKGKFTYGCLTSSNTGNEPLESIWGTCDVNSGVSYERKVIKLIT